MSAPDSRDHLRNPHHPKGTRTMTDNTNPADNVRKAHQFADNVLSAPLDFGCYSIAAAEAIKKHVPTPKPPTLAAELRSLAGKATRYGHLLEALNDIAARAEALNDIADRVETLEKERDELTYAREEGRAAADNWTNTARRLEEAQAEIARLRDRDNDDSPTPGPGCPTHLKTLEEYQNAPAGTIVQMEVPGWAHFIKDDEGCWATKGFIGYYTSESMSGTPCVVVEWGTEPVETPQPEPEHIDPANGDFLIRTLEGDMRATYGDYIIRGIQGEFYPCRSDIFEQTYQEVTND